MAKKDDFRNAAAMFIDTASDLRDEPPAEKSPAAENTDLNSETMEKLKTYLTEKGLKLTRSEARSKKLHISVTPTLAEAIKKSAGKQKKSQNELINEALEQAFLFGESKP